MIKKLRSYYEGDVFMRNSLILFMCTMFLHLSGYIYHLFMGRMLGPADYGILGSLQALIYIMVIPFNTIQTSITNFIARFKVRKEEEKISYLISYSLKKWSIYGLVTMLLFFAISPFIASFLKIPSLTPLFILGVFMFSAFLLAIGRGTLQGFQKFSQLGFNYAFEGIVKVIAGLSLVYFGFKVNGAAAGGFTIPYAACFLISLFFLIPLRKKKKEKFDTSHMAKYSFPVLLMMIATTAMYTIDMILVKHFFNDVDAGYYAALSLIGKIVFFGSMSIALVMFPKVAELHESKGNYKRTLRKSLFLTSAFCALVTLCYFVFPKLMVAALFGSKYASIIPLIGPFGFFMSMVSLTYLLAYYNISLNKKKFMYILIPLVILEAVLITLFHSSITQIIYTLICLGVVMFVSMLLVTKIQKNI